MNPLETVARFVLEALEECGSAAKMEFVTAAVRRRIEALPPNEQGAVSAALVELTSYRAPGFHEHGPH